MNVSGDSAAGYDAVRLDSMATVNRGPLIEADEDTGRVVWKDHVDPSKQHSGTFGSRTIKLVLRSVYRR